MTSDEKLLQQALDALEAWNARGRLRIMEALRARLAQPEPEPVAWLYEGSDVAGRDVCLAEDIFEEQKPNCIPLYTAPPQREWQGLTDEDWIIGKRSADYIAGAEWAEAKLKEKNT